MYYMGLDIETDDPCLKDRGKQKAKGPSWIFGEGRVICTGLYNGRETKAFEGNGGDFVKKLLLRDDVTIVGANIQYDVGWLLSSFGMDSYDVRCSFIDVAIVESLIDEYQDFSLDSLALKYLKEHKKKSVLEDICLSLNLKGDFRQHLGKLWDEGYSREIMDYVASDADQPLRIWNLQKEIIERDKLWEGFQMNMDMIPVVISMQQKGVRIDVPKWEENCRKAQEAYERLKGDFEAKYGKVNINSPKQLSELLDRFDVPYKKRITVKGYQPADRKFTQADCFKGDELSEQKKKLKEIYSGITIEKGKLVLYLPKIYADRACAEILDRGYCAICNPVVGKPMFAECAASYDIVRDLVQYKQVKNIVDKFLGPVFGRFLAPDGRLHGTFNIVGARRTGRLSCTKMNLQQIPSKTKLFEKTDHEVDLAHMCRECFVPEPGECFVKLDYCLSMDSMFLTDRGYVRGEDMYKGAGLLDLDGNLQDYECYVQERDMIAFELDNGVILKQIPEHRHFGTDKAVRYIKLAKDFKVGDQLAFDCKNFAQHETCDVRKILHTRLDEETLGYICGLYLGDGYVKETGDGEIILHDRNLCVLDCSEVFTGGKHTVGSIHHAYLRKSFGKVIAQEFGRKEFKTIPDWVFTASADFRTGLIAGLLDTDAHITRKDCRITMCREPLMRKIAELLACCGIYARWCEQRVSAEKNNFGKEHTSYTLYIRIIPSDLRALIEGTMLHRDLSIWKGSSIKLSWNFDWSELPESMFRQHDGVLQKSLYNARHFRRGIPLETMNELGFWQWDKVPVTVKKITGGFKEKALIMQCDTHMFRTYNMPTMNCGQENRVVAHFASGKNGEFVQKKYNENPYFDEHDYVAKVSGLEEAHGKKVGRKYAKNLRFGVSYGMQKPTMMKNFGWSKEFCDDLYEKVAGAAPWLFEVMEQVQEVVLHRRYIRTLAGRHIHLRKGRDKDAYKYMNYLIQGSASDMTKKATVAINRSRKGETMILTVHDEDCFSVPMTEEGVERIVGLQHCMEHSSDLRVPAVCNPEIGPNWADGIEWGPEYGDVRTFIREVFRAMRNGTFYKLKERLGNYNGDESFAEFCESLEEEEEEDE